MKILTLHFNGCQNNPKIFTFSKKYPHVQKEDPIYIRMLGKNVHHPISVLPENLEKFSPLVSSPVENLNFKEFQALEKEN